MAQQNSIIKLKGKVGDLSFYKTKDGYQARTSAGIDGERIKNDPGYQRTRENNTEFAEVAATSKKIRDVLRSIILLTHDPKMAIRLNSRVFSMMRADTESLRGERKVKAASFGILRNFNFNEAAPLANTLFVVPTADMDRATGQVNLNIPEVLPESHLARPKGASHYRITLGAAIISLNEEVEASVTQLTSTDYTELKTLTAATMLSTVLPANAVSPIVVVVSVGFYQEVNGGYYPMNNGGYNALSTLAIDIA